MPALPTHKPRIVGAANMRAAVAADTPAAVADMPAVVDMAAVVTTRPSNLTAVETGSGLCNWRRGKPAPPFCIVQRPFPAPSAFPEL